MKKIKNPFLIKAYVSPTYFCDREEETKALINAATNGRDITLFALRRMGKSGLLDHVGNQLRKKHGYAYIYSDIYNTESLADLVTELSQNIIIQLFPKKNIIQKITDIFTHVSPQISLDPITGSPQIQLNYVSEKDAFRTLEELFNFVNTFNKPIYWAMDEFQQITEYTNASSVLKQLRFLVQKSTNIRFIFSGSHTSMLTSLFNSAKQPFYKSTQLIELTEINESKYASFIQKHFKNNDKTISNEATALVLSSTLSHTWYVQYLCNRLFQDFEKVAEKEVSQTYYKMLEEMQITFYRFRTLLSSGQWNLLKAIAKEEKVAKPTASKFMRTHKLNSSASVLRALKRLTTDEFIVEQYQGKTKYYRLNDVFLMRWLQWIY